MRHALSILLLCSGCTAIRAGVQLQDAAMARDAALERDAADNAPYEWTMSSLYLDKAWESMGRSAYKTSVQLARKSAEWADHAVVTVERGKRTLPEEIERINAVTHPEAPAQPRAEASLEGDDDIDLGKPKTPAPPPAPAAPVPPPGAPAPTPPAPTAPEAQAPAPQAPAPQAPAPTEPGTPQP